MGILAEPAVKFYDMINISIFYEDVIVLHIINDSDRDRGVIDHMTFSCKNMAYIMSDYGSTCITSL